MACLTNTGEPLVFPRSDELAQKTDPAFANELALTYLNQLAVPEDRVLTGKAGGDYDVYKQLLRDDQVRSTYQQRRLALVSKPWEVIAGNEDDSRSVEAADAFRENLSCLDWFANTDQMHYGIFYGYAVGEVRWHESGGLWQIGEIRPRDRGRFRWGVWGGLYLMSRRSATLGTLMQTHFDVRALHDSTMNPHGPAFWAYSTGQDHADDPYGIGLAASIYWLDFFKRNTVRFWLRYLEKYGSPTASANAPASKLNDEEEKEKILSILRDLGNDSSVAIPDDIKIELIEAKRSGTVDHDKLREMCDRGIAKLCLGQTMTSEQEGGQYKADVAKDVRDELVQSDANLMAGSFNKLFPVAFTAYNFGPDVAPPKVAWNLDQEEDKRSRADRDQKVYDMGFQPTLEYIQTHYGEGWVPRDMTAEGGAAAGNGGGGSGGSGLPGFSERDIQRSRFGHRADQLDIKSQARKAGLDYETIVGDRVAQLLGYLEEAESLDEFRQRLTAMAIDQPSPANVDRLRNEGFAGNLLGLFRKDRTADNSIQQGDNQQTQQGQTRQEG